MNTKSRRSTSLLLVSLAVVAAAQPAFADRNVRSRSRTSVNSSSRSTTEVNRNVNRNVNVDSRRDVDIDVDHHRDVDIDVDVDHHGCCYHDDHHTVATAAAVTAAAAVVGSIVYSLPPNCTTVMVGGFAYRQCGNTWYQPQISGSSTTYVVINDPR
jgi:hypothetical protein